MGLSADSYKKKHRIPYVVPEKIAIHGHVVYTYVGYIYVGYVDLVYVYGNVVYVVLVSVLSG